MDALIGIAPEERLDGTVTVVAANPVTLLTTEAAPNVTPGVVVVNVTGTPEMGRPAASNTRTTTGADVPPPETVCVVLYASDVESVPGPGGRVVATTSPGCLAMGSAS